MSFFSKASGILGINARNFHFVSQYNSRKDKRLADDKLFTKNFLKARGIGAAKLYAAIKTPAALHAFDPKQLPKRFIIKPNRGYGGEGIIAIQETKGNTYYDANHDSYSWGDLYEHCIGILDGRYAISGLHDMVLIEELLEQDEYFNNFASSGLPDIRIIVFKYVPMIAMLRLPTASSSGKANLHLGAVGIGIDIGTGKGTFGVLGNKLIKRLPSGELIKNITIPRWNDILLIAAQTQYYTQIGYLAVDLALTKGGIKILELNARAGLAIQISNQALLRKRLDKIADLKITSPAEGVRLARSLFGRAGKQKISESRPLKPIIGLYEPISILNVKDGGSILAKIDPHSNINLIDNSLDVVINPKLINIKIQDTKLRLPYKKADLRTNVYKAILSGKYLTDFLIDSTKKPIIPIVPTNATSTIDEKMILNVDKKVATLNDQIHLLSRFKPQNLEEQQKQFLHDPSFSPQFEYKNDSTNILYIKNELRKIPKKINHPLFPLYQEKIIEIKNKLLMVESIGSAEFSQFSTAVFGTVTESQFTQAENFIKQTPLVKDTSKVLKIDEVSKRLTTYLSQHNLSKWKIKILDQATAGMQINKNNTIMVDRAARITVNRLKALITHEIETHIFRLENGRLQKYQLFEQGTAGYLSTEEGLAIYNQNKLNISLGEKYFTPALNTIAVYLGKTMSFQELFGHLVQTYNQTPEKSWRICVRVKRGLTDTAQPGTFTKDALYYSGLQMIEQYVKDNGANELKKLYVGKIGITDLQYITDFREWPIKFFPEQ